MAKKKKKDNFANKQKVFGVLLFLIALLLLVSLITHRTTDDSRILGEVDARISPFETQYLNQGGMVGAYLSYFTLTFMGWLAFFIPLGILLISFKLFQSEIAEKLKLNSSILFVVSLLGTMLYNIHVLASRSLSIELDSAGGYFTEKLTWLFIKIFGEIGSYIIVSGIILILLMIYTTITPLLASRIKLPNIAGSKDTFSSFSKAIASMFSLSKIKEWFSSETEDNENDDEFDEKYPALAKQKEDKSKSSKIRLKRKEEDTSPQLDFDNTPEKEDEEPEEKAHTKSTGKSLNKAEQLQMDSLTYMYPKTDLLNANPHNDEPIDHEELKFTAKMLRETLETFNVKIEGEIAYYPGPIITRYEFKPGTGVKINQIVNLADDLALALRAKRIRIIAPIPGKAAVGVEIPNRKSQMVYLRDIIESSQYANSKHILPLALGKTTSGKPFVADLTKMPHLLIAGATGSGKSVGMNIMITSFLYRLHPHQVRFIFIDPKMLELSVYKGIPHLGRPVVTKPKRAEKVLSDAVVEMENRYRKLANASVRNIADFNAKQTDVEKKIPYIVICVDELADLMMSATSSKIELLITRLAQMSRAVGIHLILATQRPSVDVITGLIKANFPARIAYQVSTKVDSRTILDGNGAEKLLGNGDMLFLETGQPEPIRIHGAYISSEETDAIVTFIRDQGIEMMTIESISQSTGEPTSAEVDFGDPLFKEACEVVIRHKQGSVSLLQRRLGIGYQRAARLIDKLEQAGIVSSFDGSKAREVLVDKTFLETLMASNGAAPKMTSSEQNQ
ncbi:MAG: DNA translocase FtsK [Calditrichaeota bacterium]|nr:MAG: DNA translocase FtsK [Calditrichota bacterium]